MKELKKKVMHIIDELNEDWTSAIKEGEKDGIDLASMFKQFSAHISELDTAFTDAEVRMSQKKKRW